MLSTLLASAAKVDVTFTTASPTIHSSPLHSFRTFLYTPLGTTLVLLALSSTLLYYFVFSHHAPNAPPYYSILYKLVTGQYNFKDNGPLGLVWDGYKQKGDVFRIQLAHQPVTLLLGSHGNAAFFKATDDVLSQREVYGFFTPVSGKGLVYDAPPNILIQQLRFLQHGLERSKLRVYVHKIIEEAETYFSRSNPRFSSDEGTVDLYSAISELTINTASSTLLGAEIRKNVETEFAVHYHHLSMGITPISVIAPYAPTKAHRERDHARREIVKLFQPIIENRRARNFAVDDPQRPNDFLQDLLEAKYEGRSKVKEGDEKLTADGRHLTTDEIVGMLVSALFAGQHTSNITTTWLVLSLIQKPELLKDVMREQVEILGEHDSNKENGAATNGSASEADLSYERLSDMQFLEHCIMETLRLFPPLIFLMRKVKKPLHVTTSTKQSYTVPAGDIVAVSPAVSGRLESSYGKDVLEYNPYRYADGKGEQLKKSYAWSGFGGGRHECLGRFFAMMQIKTIVSVMFRNFEFELTDKFPERDFDAMVVGPKAPTIIKYKRRKQPVV